MGLVVNFVKDLDTPLLGLSRGDVFTLRDGCAGTHIFGGIGSGKTSGSGRMLAGAYLRSGMGGIVTCAKPDDIPLWKRYLAEHGRSNSLLLFDENEGFNFLDYEMARQGPQGINTLVECLMRVLEAAKTASATASKRGEQAFWEDTTREILRYTLPPLYAAKGSLSIPDIIRFVSSAPSSLRERDNIDWQNSSFMYQVLNAAFRRPRMPMSEAGIQKTLEYWGERFPAIPDKTRGNIVITVTTTLDRFNHGRLQRAFCGRTTVIPELTFHGAVILLAMPTLTWNEDGIIAQQLFKFMWQRAVLGRNSLPEEHRERPVFLHCDEAQETVSSYDGEFLSLCRASKCCVTYMTQSLPTYYAKIGGDNPRDAALALVGKFMTNVFHSNACPETNEYAARVIGKVTKQRRNYSTGRSTSVNLGMSAGSNDSWGGCSSSGSSMGKGSFGTNWNSGENSGGGNNWGENRGRGTSRNESSGCTEVIEYAIEPGDFARSLLTGGPQNRNRVTGIWFQAGRMFKKSGMNFLWETFEQ